MRHELILILSLTAIASSFALTTQGSFAQNETAVNMSNATSGGNATTGNMNPKRNWTRHEDKKFFVYEKLLRT